MVPKFFGSSRTPFSTDFKKFYQTHFKDFNAKKKGAIKTPL
jgi:hypothetical protein